jgi:thiol:disulfide interchange protein DsbC
MMTIRSAAVALLCGFSTALLASPEETAFLEVLKQRYPATTFSRVESSAVPDVFEVWMGTNVAYVHRSKPDYFFFGHLFDVANAKDLTAPKLAQAQRIAAQSVATINFRDLPLDDAIKTVRGKGSRVLAVFSDPACQYCKQLEPELAKLQDVTIYTFLVPFQGIEKPMAIWCATDRSSAWQRAMSDSGEPVEAKCDHPLERNLALARKLNVNGTPTLFFGDGARLDGVAQAAAIQGRLVGLATASAASVK